MECRKLEITLVSANSLPDVRSLGQMKVYAKVSIKGESKTSKRSPVDFEGETNPRWNFRTEYTISESAVQQPDVKISIRLYCKRTLGNRFIGDVSIPIKSLFDKGIKADKILSYRVAGTENGVVNILYRFGNEKVLVRKPSSWKNIAFEVGFFVLLGGAVLLLADNNSKNSIEDNKSNVRVDDDNVGDDDDDDDDDVFYDAC
ncbi:hypothetical protein ABFS82_14G313800 [Erythranthe guttata]|nr:PREDICTED: uncharacterized protein LOC105972995 [Erythranthe guttata]|eukprot:XP_012853438.1 PREDICTED: uncharacterized protein LOC105972995 [Erythranthe guttata]